ncbi:biopolymer transporter ExbD [Alkalinema sp. FACHB-956]|uniref:ExbD/TolR family protein n=1 Tax=Alkalinema sp. FACHB-956 TaxID=2692768 RepID=UPI0016852D2D|nr:biopolymer transporter ExbD [Alkalinema sp. FACHB-956]MBD2326869.1 biopolymer transporter ExbD [Alkalinema sp. FACHB-956]
MKFKSQSQKSQMPEVNLVPMMDVVMTILTFFIIVSMTLTRGKGAAVKVNLPSTQAGTAQEKTPQPMIVTLDAQGRLYLGKVPATLPELGPQVVSYLQQDPQGVVLLKADRALPYEKVVQILGQLRQVGGDRVSLAIEG